MFFAMYFPGLGLTAERLSAMTLAETRGLRRHAEKLLRDHMVNQVRIVALGNGFELR